jgi:hypothetical protein
VSTLPPPAEFHSGIDLEDVFVEGWDQDPDVRSLKPGVVLPFRVSGNPHHHFYCQAIFVGVDCGVGHLLVDRKSISEALYRNTTSQEG